MSDHYCCKRCGQEYRECDCRVNLCGRIVPTRVPAPVAVTDLIATLRTAMGNDGDIDAGFAALDELERRARIEARRDTWLKTDSRYSVFARVVDGRYYVTLSDGTRSVGAKGTGPDYWTALEAALNAAGES